MQELEHPGAVKAVRPNQPFDLSPLGNAQSGGVKPADFGSGTHESRLGRCTLSRWGHFDSAQSQVAFADNGQRSVTLPNQAIMVYATKPRNATGVDNLLSPLLLPAPLPFPFLPAILKVQVESNFRSPSGTTHRYESIVFRGR